MSSEAFAAASSGEKRYLIGSDGDEASDFEGPALAEGAGLAAGADFFFSRAGLDGDDGASLGALHQSNIGCHIRVVRILQEGL